MPLERLEMAPKDIPTIGRELLKLPTGKVNQAAMRFLLSAVGYDLLDHSVDTDWHQMAEDFRMLAKMAEREAKHGVH